jgi:phage shock protein B
MLAMNWDLAVIFTFVIAIIAVSKHYKRLDKISSAGLAQADAGALDRAMDTARRLEQRVETLERLLDEDAPGWRARSR